MHVRVLNIGEKAEVHAKRRKISKSSAAMRDAKTTAFV
jgi:hypothetical protein